MIESPDFRRDCQPERMSSQQRTDQGMIDANVRSRDYHAPWVQPFTDLHGFEDWPSAIATGANIGLIARERGAGSIVGVVIARMAVCLLKLNQCEMPICPIPHCIAALRTSTFISAKVLNLMQYPVTLALPRSRPNVCARYFLSSIPRM